MHRAALEQLLDRVEALCAEVRRELPVIPTDSDLISLKDAEREFGRSNDTLRRWVKRYGLGEVVDGKLFVSRSKVAEVMRPSA